MAETDHLGGEVVAAFVRGALTAAEAEQVERHIDQCTECRQLMSELARAPEPARSVASAPTEPDGGARALPAVIAPTRPVVPLRVDRYLVLKQLGAGGMGRVFAAYDPKLNRKIALKLLRPESSNQRQHRARMLREAQAMALLSHPNVAQVFDAGVSAEDDVFIAMELLDGGTLGRWLKTDPPWRDVLSRFLKAGEGLAAAHQAGLVHRDFKPDNVLLSKDGQVKVTDFGIAREGARKRPTSPGVVPAELKPLTRTGAVMGTPRYMAPEQLSGSVDARSDQFSYCVALYEALFHVLPYVSESAPAVALAATEAKLSRPPGPVPELVFRPLQRGLSPRPDERYPSMQPLLDELRAALFAGRRRLVVFGIAAAVVLVAVATLVGRSAAPALSCASEAGLVEGAWSPRQSAAVRDAFTSTKSPIAAELWQKSGSALDAYAAAWRRAREGACTSYRVKGVTSAAAYEATASCLDGRLRQLDAAVQGLLAVDAAEVERAPDLVQALPQVELCAQQAIAPVPEPPASCAVEVAAVRAVLAKAAAAAELGQRVKARALADDGVTRAAKVSWAPLEAEAAAVAAQLEATYDTPERARQRWFTALAFAREGGQPEVEARAWVGLAGAAWHGAKWSEVDAASRAARVALAHVALPDENVNLEYAVAMAAAKQARWDAATAAAGRCVALAGTSFGEKSTAMARCEHLKGIIAYYWGDDTQTAVDHFIREVGILEATHGPSHPSVSLADANVGVALCNLGRAKAGLGYAAKGIEIARRAYGPDSTELIQRLLALSFCRAHTADRAAPRPELEQALALLEKAPDNEWYVDAHLQLGELRMHQRRFREAAVELQKTEARIASRFEAGHPNLKVALYGLGRVELELHQPAEALRHLERSVAIVKEKADPEIELYFGRALWESGRDKERGVTVMSRARAQLAAKIAGQKGDLWDDDALEVFDAWAKLHPGVIVQHARQ